MVSQKQLRLQRRFIHEAALELGCIRIGGAVSQRRFAEAVGLTPSTISRLMRGHHPLSESSEAAIRRAIAERKSK